MDTGIDVCVRELAEAVAQATDLNERIHWDSSKQDDIPKKQLDISRLASFGWKARICL